MLVPSALAVAAPAGGPAGLVGTTPGTALVVPECTAEPGCWTAVPALSRFAPGPGLLVTPLMARVRLAWNQGDLLVQATELPPGARVEVALGREAGTDRLVQADLLVQGEGTARLRVRPGLRPGDERPLRVGLVLPDGAHGELFLPWAPAGAGDPTAAATALFVREPLARPAPELRVEGDRLLVRAPEARLALVQEQPAQPRGARWLQDPWQTQGGGSLDVALPPESGWYRLTATWSDAAGQAVDRVEHRFYLERPGPAAGAAAGIHPAPRWLEARAGAPFRPTEGDCVSGADWPAAAELLAEELGRFTGLALPVSGGPCRIRVAALDEAVVAPKGLELGRQDDGFALLIEASGATALAHDLRGAVYGALALADAVGPDGTAPPLAAADAPALGLRALVHNLNLRASPDWPLETWRAFLRRVVARGRYDLVVLTLNDSMRYEGHPEVAHGRALSVDQVRQLLAWARELGIEVAPGTNSPGHADWLASAWPELREDANGSQVCTRHPGTWPLVEEIDAELVRLFREGGLVRFFHLGHDEIPWTTEAAPGDERCPRCAGTPRWELLRLDLERQAAWCAASDLRCFVYSDMLLRDWNGGREGTWRTPASLSAQARERLVLAAWSKLGDTVGTLGRGLGFDVIRQHTGYSDWKRADLEEEATAILGEAMGVFTPTPWSSFGPGPGSRALNHQWGSVLLAGTTAWTPALGRSPIAPSLAALAGEAAYLPGYRHPPRWTGRTHTLRPRGAEPTADLPAFAWPREVRVTGVPFDLRAPVVARPGAPVTVAVRERVAALAVLQAAVVDHFAENRLRMAAVRAAAPPVALLRLTLAGGTQVEKPLVYGLDTFRPDGDPRSALLWGAAGSLALPSPEAARADPRAGDRHLYRSDWINPHPEQPVESVEISVLEEGVVLVVGGATALLGSRP